MSLSSLIWKEGTMILIFDTEGDGIFPTKLWCTSAIDFDTRKVYEFGPDEIDQALKLLQQADVLVGHNIIGYDLPHIKRLYGVDLYDKKIIDTLVLSRLYNPTQEGGHSLEAWGYRLGFPKVEHEDWSKYTKAMQHRCTSDVRLNLKVYVQLIGKMGKAFSEDAIQLEHDVAHIINEQIKYGWKFNYTKAEQLLAQVNDDLGRLEDEVHKTFKPKVVIEKVVTPKRKKDGTLSRVGLRPEEYEELKASGSFEPFNRMRTQVFNLGSRQQIGEWLIDFGWKPTEFTETGLPKVSEAVLETITNIPEADLINEYLSTQKIRGFLINWLESCTNGRQHGYVNPCGAVTCRMTHSRPNLAQVPSGRKKYGMECRSLFTVASGYKQVGTDAEGLEMRIFAHYLNNAEYIRAVIEGNSKDGTDAHTKTMVAAGLDNRDLAKTVYYALIFGARDKKLGNIVGGNKKDGERIRDNLYKNLPGLEDLVEGVQKVAKGRGFLIGLDKRPIRVRSLHAALNTLIQSAGAIIMKRFLVILYNAVKAAGLDVHFVGNIHDEVQAEVLEEHVDKYKELCYSAMIQAGEYYGLRCAMAASVDVGTNWSETH